MHISLVTMNKTIRLSINVLSAVRLLLKNAELLSLSSEENLWTINTSQINTSWLIDIIRQCGWMSENERKELNVSDRGHMVITGDEASEDAAF